MNHSSDGMTLWYGTPDAPAPQREIPGAQSVPLVVGVSPISSANFVDVRYRVDGGPLRTASGTELRSDERKGAQYFGAKIPIPPGAHHVDYCPVAHCGGAQVPRAGEERQAFTSFDIAQPKPVAPTAAAEPAIGVISETRYEAGLEFLVRVIVKLKKPVTIGKTPEGLRIDFFAQSGTARGGNFRAKVLENTVDYMLVRPDGIGNINVHATLLTEDGALITAAYLGMIDLGPDGYERMARADYPILPSIQLAPRLLTEDKRYDYLNKTYLLGVGQVDLQRLIVQYDAYAVKTLVSGK